MILTDENFRILCAKHYDSIDICSFNEDITRIYMVRKMIKRYISSGEINERLILNHLIILFNVFDDFTIKIVYYIFKKEEYKYINAFLLFLNRLPESQFETGVDIYITKKLEQI